MALSETISIFRSIAGLFLGLTIFGLLVLPDHDSLVQLLRILSMLIFAIATLTPVYNYHDRIRYIYTAIYGFGAMIAIPLIFHAFYREPGGSDYAVMIFRLLQIEIFIIFAIISVNSATTSIKSHTDMFH